MATRLRRNIVDQIYNYCRKEYGAGTKYQIASQIRAGELGQLKFNPSFNLINNKNEKVKCEVPISTLQSDLVDDIVESEEKQSKKAKRGVKVYTCISNPKNEIKEILESNPTDLSAQLPGRKVIVEFSSPNIAKPFHVGHIRSTIIGNAIANIKEKLGEKVIRMNYLGDWGTQFGLLDLGIRLAGYSEEQLKEKPMELLLDAYVKANAEAEKNPEFREKALKVFADLEGGSKESLESWEKLKAWTVDYLENMYGRIGIRFDEYEWESSYRKSKINEVLNKLKDKNLLETDSKSRICAKVKDQLVPLMKSDGSTLYLVRDLGAIYDRRLKHDFDELYYIVENGQSLHFQTLFNMCEELDFDKIKNVHHVKFSLIQNLSTRKGQIIFLEDVFNEARNLILEQQKERENTKVIDEKVADAVGISAVVISDLKRKRTKPYEFDWSKALEHEGSTGVKLQYTHCRLNNLVERFEDKVAKECDPEVLKEDEAVHLVNTLRKYEESILQADINLEPHVLVEYLFVLSKASNNAYENLQVQDVDSHVASQRLLLFESSRKVLEDGMKILGLKALKKM